VADGIAEVTGVLSRPALIGIAQTCFKAGVNQLDAEFIIGYLLGRAARRAMGVDPRAPWSIPEDVAYRIGYEALVIAEEAARGMAVPLVNKE
jgi:hypothetical protein